MLVQRPGQASAVPKAVRCHPLQAAFSAGLENVHVPEYDAWDGLSLTYTLKWPLHILLTPEVKPADLHTPRHDCAPTVSHPCIESTY